MEECNCDTPGDKKKDFLVAVGPNGKVAWWARKDCPLHGIRYIGEDAAPVEPGSEASNELVTANEA